MSKRVFISYEHDGEKSFVNGLRGMISNNNIDIDFYDESVKKAIDSYDASYIKSVIKDKINRASTLLCIVGRDTHSSEWVKWEIETARKLGKDIIFMRRKDDFSSSMTSSVLGYKTIKNWDLNLLKAL